jgi:hypothetical protein
MLDGPPSGVFFNEFQELLLFGLGESYGFADEGWGCPRFELDCMVLGL